MGTITGSSYKSDQSGLSPDQSIGTGASISCSNMIGTCTAPGACNITQTGQTTKFHVVVTNGTVWFTFQYDTSSPQSPVINVFEPQ